jgi:hypothetical protein
MPSGVGMNLWNIGWGAAWTDYFKAGVDWASATDPWNPSFLNDLSNFKGPIRFMDWDNANDSPIVRWEDRMQKTDDHYGGGKTIDIDPTMWAYYGDYAPSYRCTIVGVAYEWMIDLCNRTGHDLWICVPTFANDDYCSQLARLIKSSLDPNLKVYLEYSNETWNGVFRAYQYTVDKAAASIAEGGMGLSAENEGYRGGEYSVYRSLQVFQLFEEVFGAENTGADRRLVRCLCAGGNEDISAVAIRNIIYDGTFASDYRKVPFNSTWNPHGQRPDVYGLAPYVGFGLDGSSSNVVAQFRVALNERVRQIKLFKKMAVESCHYPLVAYEGGQHLLKNADVFSQNPEIYDEYLRYMNTWRDQGFSMFVHYTLYSTWNSSGAWGAKESVASKPADSPKYRALIDWQAANP